MRPIIYKDGITVATKKTAASGASYEGWIDPSGEYHRIPMDSHTSWFREYATMHSIVPWSFDDIYEHKDVEYEDIAMKTGWVHVIGRGHGRVTAILDVSSLTDASKNATITLFRDALKVGDSVSAAQHVYDGKGYNSTDLFSVDNKIDLRKGLQDVGMIVSATKKWAAIQVDSPEFQDWFAGSKVVDEDGNPLKVYHGTGKGKFDSFETPAFFTPKKSGAEFYTGRGGKTPTLYETYLNITNPFRLENKADMDKFLELLRRAGVTVDVTTTEYGDSWVSPDIRAIGHEADNGFDYVYLPQVQRQLEAEGYDGMMGWDYMDNYEIPIWVAFNADQIRVAGHLAVDAMKKTAVRPPIPAEGETLTPWDKMHIAVAQDDELSEAVITFVAENFEWSSHPDLRDRLLRIINKGPVVTNTLYRSEQNDATGPENGQRGFRSWTLNKDTAISIGNNMGADNFVVRTTGGAAVHALSIDDFAYWRTRVLDENIGYSQQAEYLVADSSVPKTVFETDVRYATKKQATVLYRGAQSHETHLGDFFGAWFSASKDTAKQYGDLFSYEVPGIDLLDSNSEEATVLVEEYAEEYPQEAELGNQGGDYAELWMFPPDSFVLFLDQAGYDGYTHGTDIFISRPAVNTKVKYIGPVKESSMISNNDKSVNHRTKTTPNGSVVTFNKVDKDSFEISCGDITGFLSKDRSDYGDLTWTFYLHKGDKVFNSASEFEPKQSLNSAFNDVTVAIDDIMTVQKTSDKSVDPIPQVIRKTRTVEKTATRFLLEVQPIGVAAAKVTRLPNQYFWITPVGKIEKVGDDTHAMFVYNNLISIDNPDIADSPHEYEQEILDIAQENGFIRGLEENGQVYFELKQQAEVPALRTMLDLAKEAIAIGKSVMISKDSTAVEANNKVELGRLIQSMGFASVAAAKKKDIPTIAKAVQDAWIKKVGDDSLQAYCFDVSKDLAAVLNKNGYNATAVQGTYTLDDPNMEFSEDMDEDDPAVFTPVHHWVDVDGKVLDVTAKQFNDEIDTPNPDIVYGDYSEFTRYNKSGKGKAKRSSMISNNDKSVDPIPQVIRKTHTVEETEDVCPHCNATIHEKGLCLASEDEMDKPAGEWLWKHRACGGVFTLPERTAVKKTAGFKTASEIYEKFWISPEGVLSSFDGDTTHVDYAIENNIGAIGVTDGTIYLKLLQKGWIPGGKTSGEYYFRYGKNASKAAIAIMVTMAQEAIGLGALVSIDDEYWGGADDAPRGLDAQITNKIELGKFIRNLREQGKMASFMVNMAAKNTAGVVGKTFKGIPVSVLEDAQYYTNAYWWLRDNSYTKRDETFRSYGADDIDAYMTNHLENIAAENGIPYSKLNAVVEEYASASFDPQKTAALATPKFKVGDVIKNWSSEKRIEGIKVGEASDFVGKKVSFVGVPCYVLRFVKSSATGNEDLNSEFTTLWPISSVDADHILASDKGYWEDNAEQDKTACLKTKASLDMGEELSNEEGHVIGEFLQNPDGKQPWEVVPAAQLKKVWNAYMKNGMVTGFNEKIIDSIADRMITNIARLNANTELAGHARVSSKSLYEDNGYEFNEELHEEKFGDYITDPTSGQWRLSDYGLDKLAQLGFELSTADTAEKKLVIIDQMFNVAHQRSDLAALFVEGGSATLSELFARPSDNEAVASKKSAYVLDASHSFVTADKSSEDIVAIINKVNKKTDVAYGNCGVFAVALNTVLGGTGTYLALVEEYEPEMYSHVALKYNGKLYDGYGETTKREMREYGFDDEHPRQKLSFLEIDESEAIRGTERIMSLEDMLAVFTEAGIQKTAADSTAEAQVLLDFPELRQVSNYSCGSNAMQSILGYYGTDIREDELIEKLHTNKEEGTEVKDMTRVAKEFGLKTKPIKTVEDLQAAIKDGMPVLLTIQAWEDEENTDWENTWDAGHYVVAIGYNDKEIIFEDPSSENRTYLTFDELDKRWHDLDADGSKLEHWGLAVYGKEPKYNSEELVHMGTVITTSAFSHTAEDRSVMRERCEKAIKAFEKLQRQYNKTQSPELYHQLQKAKKERDRLVDQELRLD